MTGKVLTRNWTTIPHVTHRDEVGVTASWWTHHRACSFPFFAMCPHRVINGSGAARFVWEIARVLADPAEFE
jgi:pyruvate/2-oxoglutarate dehydrogenase complex dihydrolipoamide acyltransferase (E2) component